MFLSDTLTLDAPRRTTDGYLAVRAKAARTGHYEYSGRDVDPDNAHGLRDEAIVHVARDAAAVFDQRAVHSFIGKPITNDHPSESVTARNWKDHARGTIMGAKWEEGGYLAFDLLLTDATAIAAVDSGKRELSNGYNAEIEFGDFTASDGTKCQARQTKITGNHVALVDRGRAGPECRIADAPTCDAAPQSFLDSLTQEKPVKNFMLDGLPVNLGDADVAVATMNTVRDQRDAARKEVTDLQAKAVADAATIVAKDAEIVKLTADVAAAKLTPAQMRDAGKAYAIVAAKAKAVGVAVTDAMDESAIQRAVVDKSMGDAAKAYSDEHIAIAFHALTKDVKIDDRADPLADMIRGQVTHADAIDVEGDRAKRRTAISDAWRQPATGNA